MAMLGLCGDKKLKMKPLFILIAAIALGLIFLGIVLTIVGHWPGYTSWGSNPLKYLGPALFGIGVIAMVGVIAYCCVISEADDPDNDLEKKEFVDISNPQSGANTPSVVVRDSYDTEMKQPGQQMGSAFGPYTPNDDMNSDVNVLNMLKDSPGRDRKFSSNYNTGNGANVPTPSYPSETSKKSVGYNSYAYSSDGDKMKVVVEERPKPPYMQPQNRFIPPQNNNADKVKLAEEPKQKTNYIQPVQTYIPPQGPRKWGSAEKIIDSSSGSAKTPPRSPKAASKSNGNPNQGVFLERAPGNVGPGDQGRMPALHQPVVGRRSRGRYRQGSTEEPPSPTRRNKPENQREFEEPDLEVKRTLIVPNNQGKNSSAKWGTHGRNQDNGAGQLPNDGRGVPPTESTPKDDYSSREYDKGREYYKQFSDPQGHMSRRERDKQSRSRHGSRDRDRDRDGGGSGGGSRRDRSSSGHRRHRSRSHERHRARDDAYSANEIDYITGAPIRKSGRSKSQERNSSRYGGGGSGRSRSGSRRSRSQDRGLSHSYDSDDYHRRHRYHDQSSHSSRDPYRTGETNVGYDRDGSSDESHGMSPKHRSHHLNHSNSTGTSADDFLRSGQLALSPSSGNKKQTMNFTINVNAHPGSAVQIAMGGQKLPQARPMLPGNTSINLAGNTDMGGASDVHLTQIPYQHQHNSSVESSSSRTRPVRT